jgi:glutamate-5-semialdehyde dehydrogenase
MPTSPIMAIASVIRGVLKKNGLNEDFMTLLPADRSATEALLNAVQYVDVIIPRGSQSLINYVRDNAKVPVIETGAGIVHVYVDETGDLEKAIEHCQQLQDQTSERVQRIGLFVSA